MALTEFRSPSSVGTRVGLLNREAAVLGLLAGRKGIPAPWICLAGVLGGRLEGYVRGLLERYG